MGHRVVHSKALDVHQDNLQEVADMPLPGGPADKAGNRYEGLWTVCQLAEILDGKAESITLEPLGADGTGVEFWVQQGTERVFHQVKRQRSGSGSWTMTALATEGILATIRDKLAAPCNRFVFVSSLAASQLLKLTGRAQTSASWEQFRQYLLTGEADDAFSQLRHRWRGISEHEIYEYLKRIEIRVLDETSLRERATDKISLLVEGNAASAVEVLSHLALSSVHEKLTADQVWQHLQERGFDRRRWADNPQVKTAVLDATALYVNDVQSLAIGGRALPRDEVKRTVDKLSTSDDEWLIFVTGDAGMGKSGVIAQVVEAMSGRGWPTLAFRVDGLAPTQLPEEVGRQIGLPGSPAHVLAAVAKGKPCLLAIDQLDAFSIASGRHTDFLDCLLEIVRQARQHPNVRVVLGCRKFDIENDNRLGRLRRTSGGTEPIDVKQLAAETVQAAVTHLGLRPDRLTDKQIQLFSVPLHLHLLESIERNDAAVSLNFETGSDLFDKFWEHKQRVIQRRLSRPVRWASVIDAMCDYMSSKRTLSVPEAHLDNFERGLIDAMASERVLIKDNKRWRFFHESFFDYAYARSFSRRPGTIRETLLAEDQHLFRRAQVRQILSYLRDTHRARYLDELRDLVSSPHIRKHLKQTILAVLARVPDPSEQEWAIVEPLVTDPTDPLGWGIIRPLVSSVSWFDLLESLGTVRQWLASGDDHTIDLAVTMLSKIQKQRQDQVAQLVEAYVGESPAWDNRLLYLVRTADLSQSRQFLDIFIRLIKAGKLDDAFANGQAWMHLMSLTKDHPDWACEIAGHFLARIAAACQADGTSIHQELSTMHGAPDIMACARNSPIAFVREILPFMLWAIQTTSSPAGSGLCSDMIWSYRSSEKPHTLAEAILIGMEQALAAVADHAPKLFETTLAVLRATNSKTCHCLVIRAYTRNGSSFADIAIDYVVSTGAELAVPSDLHLRWSIRELLEATTPHCSDAQVPMLERCLLNYYSEYERSPHGRRSFGWSQYTLLEGICPQRRSVNVRRRLQELERKFKEHRPTRPHGTVAVWVDSPIPDHAAQRMTDAAWLGALARHGDQGPRQGNGASIGGVHKLARTLETCVAQDPIRFARLLPKFEPDTHPAYFSAILNGLSNTELRIEDLIPVLEKCHQLPARPVGLAIARLIRRVATQRLPDQILEIISWYATEDPDPDESPSRLTTRDSLSLHEGDLLDDDLLIAGINSTRGAAAEAIAHLLFHDGNRVPLLESTLKRIVRDRSLAVRSCVAEALIALLNHDRPTAVQLFHQLCNTDDALLASHHIVRFLMYGVQTHYEELDPLIDRMLASTNPRVNVAGARVACFAALRVEAATTRLSDCLTGSEEQRVGAAQILVRQIATARSKRLCEDSLVRLFYDQSLRVRSEAAKVISHLPSERFSEYAELVQEFLNSPSCEDNLDKLLFVLDDAHTAPADVVYEACERFIRTAGPAAGDITTSAAGDSYIVSRLIMRLCSQSTEPGLVEKCLDVIDQMISVQAFGIDKTLEPFER